jgi:hypothetical protein
MYLFNPGEQILVIIKTICSLPTRQIRERFQNVLVSFSKQYRNVFDITTGLLMEKGQPLHQLEDIW